MDRSSSIAFFGLFIAFPLRNYCIIERKLLFPSGTATATVIRTLHADPSHVRKSLKLLTLFACFSMVKRVFMLFLRFCVCRRRVFEILSCLVTPHCHSQQFGCSGPRQPLRHYLGLEYVSLGLRGAERVPHVRNGCC